MKRRILSVILSVVLSASMVMPAFAAENVAGSEMSEIVEGTTLSEGTTEDEEFTSSEVTSSEESSMATAEENSVVTEETSVDETSVEETESLSETEELIVEAVSHEEIELVNALSNDEMYEAYVSRLIGIDGEVQLESSNLREKLNTYEKNIYDYLAVEVEKIATGTRSDTVINIPASVTGHKYKYSASELGYSSITYENASEASQKISAEWVKDISLKNVFNALLSDMPEYMFWYNTNSPKNWDYGSDSIDYSGKEADIVFPKKGIYVTCYVVPEFSATSEANTSSTDITKMIAPQTAVNNARTIASKYSLSDDLEKMTAFKDEICELVSLDSSITSSGALQFVRVFDNDPTTNVSSAGYATAFQFLCNEAPFGNGAIKVNTLYGSIKETETNLLNMEHVWNLVHLDTDKTYFADITYCDEGQIGYSDGLFMVGGETLTNTYRVKLGAYTVGYGLRSDMPELYSASDLTISKANLVQHDFTGLTNNDVVVTWDSIISNKKVDGKYQIKYVAKARCKHCNKDIVVASNKVSLPAKAITAEPGCMTNGKTGTGQTISKDFLGTGSIRKVTIPSREIAMYGSHDFPDEWTVVSTKTGLEKHQCRRTGCGEIEERYTKGTDPTCAPPTDLTAFYGQKLSEISINNPGGNTAGSWEWEDDKQYVGNVGTNTFYATFTPSDTETYHPMKKQPVSILVKEVPYTGEKETSCSIGMMEGCYTDVTLPDIPEEAVYGDPISNSSQIAVSINKDTGVVRLVSMGISVELSTTVMVRVTDALNYADYDITITVTPKQHVHAINKNKYHKEIPATKTTDGMKEYYECANGCNKKLKRDGSVITDMDLVIPREDIVIRLDANGGKFADDNNVRTYRVKYQGVFPTFDIPSFDYGNFSGWTTDAAGNNNFNTSASVNIEDDIVLYAKWNRPELSVTFVNEVASNKDVKVKKGLSVAKSEKTIPDEGTKSGYVFMGWYLNSAGTGEEFTENTVVTTATSVYAKWGKKGMDISLSSKEFTYTGSQIKPEVTSVKFDGVELTPGTDYSISYKNNTHAFDDLTQTADILDKSAPAVVITGKGNYAGVYKEYYKINPKNLADEDIIVADIDTVIESNRDAKPNPSVTWGKTKLVNNRDYTIVYYTVSDDKGTPVTPRAKGKYRVYAVAKDGSNYIGSTDGKYFEIAAADKKLISKTSINYPKTKSYNDGNVISIANEIIIKDAGKTLTKGVDYIVYEATPTEIGTVPVIICGNGKYTGEKKISYQITGTALSKAKLKNFETTKDYTGSAITQNIDFYMGNSTEPLRKISLEAYNAIASGSAEKRQYDYTIEYLNNKEIGTATVIYRGVNAYSGEVKKTFAIKGENVSSIIINNNVFIPSFVYNGGANEQIDYTLLDKFKNHINWATPEQYANMSASEKANINVIVEYKDNINAGTAKMIIKGVNNYTGTKTKTFKINQYDIQNAGDNITIKLNKTYEYCKGGTCPEVEVYYIARKLEQGKDYTVSYVNNKNLSDGTGTKAPVVKITGKGNFKGVKLSDPFAIEAKVMRDEVITVSAADKTATGRPGNWKTTVTVTDSDGKKLIAGTDYSKVVYTYGEFNSNAKIYDGSKKGNPEIIRAEGSVVEDKDIVSEGVVINVTVYGNGKNKYYTGYVTGSYRIGKTDINSLQYKIAPQAYTGREVTIDSDDIQWTLKGQTVDGIKVVVDKSSYKNNIKKGKATVLVRVYDYNNSGEYKGQYCGSRTITYTIASASLK